MIWCGFIECVKVLVEFVGGKVIEFDQLLDFCFEIGMIFVNSIFIGMEFEVIRFLIYKVGFQYFMFCVLFVDFDILLIIFLSVL